MDAAITLEQMMLDSKGAVKASDIHSSQRTVVHNKRVGGVSNSSHLLGRAIDIFGTSSYWIKRNGHRYGWCVRSYPGTHGGHFIFSPAVCGSE